MSQLNLRALTDKLNDHCRNALESALGLCVSRTHHSVDVEHYLLKLCEGQDSDLLRIFRHYNIEPGRVARELERALGRYPTGNNRAPTLSRRIPLLLRESWLIGSIEFGAVRVRSGHMLLALLREDELGQVVRDSVPALADLPLDELLSKFATLTKGSAEDERGPSAVAGGAAETAAGGKGPGGTKLEQFTVDLTERARKGDIDPVLERFTEVQQVIDILTRRRQNNPIIVGEAGVGKTAIVEGLALRVVKGDVPPPLKDVTLRILDLGLLQAGAGMRGEFESRLKAVIDEVKASLKPIILFIDEAHTLIGAGGAAGQGDAANLLKPALARGELRTIAATTWNEYKKYFEKDAALARRFQLVKCGEPSVDQAIIMLRGLVSAFEKHHKVRILDEAVESSVRLSHRYVADRHLPDKAVSVLATAAARVALSQGSTPPPIDFSRSRIAALDAEKEALLREVSVGGDFGERLDRLGKLRETERATLDALTQRWDQEKALVAELSGLMSRLSGELPNEEKATLIEQLKTRRAELSTIQGKEPLVHAFVDAPTIATVISGWTGIPLGRMVKDDIEAVLRLPEVLRQRVVGQDHALEAICQRIRTSRAGLEDRRRPIGVFLLIGPSGVGKTETALALAEALYGGERNMVTLNMSEYQEQYRVSGLTGSPHGYVGSDEGGILTEAVRRKPYTIVLLDEVEKAHPDVMEIFYQVFDRGMLSDATGIEVDFRNTLILMTSNIGSDLIHSLTADPETSPDPDKFGQALRPALSKVFQDAFLGRTVVVPYYPIRDEVMRSIIRMQLGRIKGRLKENHRAELTYDESLVTAIASRCTEVHTGARNVDHILTRTILPELSRDLLARMATGQKVGSVHISVSEKGDFVYRVE